MLKSLKFLLQQVWKYKKSYVFYEIFLQLSKLMIPISTIIFPKFIIDELMGKQRTEKFLYANGMGFGAVLDSAFNIIGNLFVFAGIVAIIITLSVWVVIIFVLLVLLRAYMDSKVRQNYTKWKFLLKEKRHICWRLLKTFNASI